MKLKKVLDQLADDHKRLEQSKKQNPSEIGPFDLAVGAHENLFNNFLTAHHKIDYASPSSVYRGQGEYPDLRLEFGYDIPNAATIDLAPIAEAKQESRRQLLLLPPVFAARKLQAMRRLLDAPEANLKIRVPKISLSLKVEGMIKPVILTYAFSVLARVEIDANRDLRFTPIKGEVEDPERLERDLQKLERRHAKAVGDPTCYEVMDLIKHLINVTIANRISNFVQVIDLPSVVKIIQGFGLGDFNVQVMENFVVVTAKAMTVAASLTTRIPTYQEVKDHLDEEIASIQKRVNDRLAGAVQAKLFNMRANLPDKWLFAFLTLNLFQQAANAALNFQDSSGDHGKEFGFIEWEWGLSYYVRNPKLAFAGDELHVDVDAGGAAFARARADTCCGATPWFGVSASLIPKPEARLKTKFYVKGGDTLMMSAGTRPMWLHVDFKGLGWPLDQVISIILSAILSFLFLVGDIIGARWTKELAKLPAKFPGTSIPAKGELDGKIPIVDGKHLAVTGKITFG